MMSSLTGEKCSSQPNLTEESQSFISTRKRKQTNEYSELQTELRSMFTLWTAQQDIKHKELIDTILESKKQGEEIKNLLEENKKQINDLKIKQDSLTLVQDEAFKRIDFLEKELEEINRLHRMNIMEISNIPETKTIKLADVVKNLHEAIGVPFDQNFIKRIYRAKLGLNKIVVEYKESDLKQKVLNAVKDHNKNAPEKMNSEVLKLGIEKTSIYVSDSLTATARKLYFSARQLVKSGKCKYCWISEGKILLREKDGQSAIHVKTQFQLDHFITKLTQA